MAFFHEKFASNYTSSRRHFLASSLALIVCQTWAKESLVVIHQGRESVADTRNVYYWSLLGAALEITRQNWGDYRVLEGSMMNGLRAFRELQLGSLNIIVRSTDPTLEDTFQPIRIPLEKGLLGYRVFLIRRELQSRLDLVRNLEDLRHFSIGQSRAWNDVAILKNAGFKVVAGDHYETLFSMLSAGRFDLFSRSITEASSEILERQQQFPDLVIEKRLLLYYPLPHYLFVRRDAAGDKLAKRIEAGFEMMQKDGSFNRLFAAYRAPLENALNLKDRLLFRIPNPTLPVETPLNRPELWYDPTK